MPAPALVGFARMIHRQFLKIFLFEKLQVLFDGRCAGPIHFDPEGIQFLQRSAADPADDQRIEHLPIQSADGVAGPVDMVEILILDRSNLVL
jgi:hypothetical protein